MESDRLLVCITLGSAGLLFYSYVGYPVLLWILTALKRRPNDAGEPVQLPSVSVVISAYNEEQTIGARIENLLSLDYPRAQVEILIGSDGSSDRTAKIAESYSAVRLFAFKQRRGKASVVNDLIAAAEGEIVVLTDANTFFYGDALRQMVAALYRHSYGSIVVGRLDIHSASAQGNLDGAYWRYETWMKAMESRFGSLLGANGAIYAFRRDRYQPLAPGAIVDDFLVPMLMRLRFGDRIFFVPEARAWERSPDKVGDEFRRRVRIGAGDFQALRWTWPLLLPWNGMIALTYFSHKVLRWLGPWFMVAALVGSLMLRGHWPFEIFLLAQLAFYALALGGTLLRPLPGVGRVASTARYFVVLNAGLFLGLLRLSVGAARPTWSTAPRTLEGERS